MRSTEKTFEGAYDGVGMLTRSWLHHQIRVGRFSVDRRCKAAVRELFDEAVQECYGVVLLVLNSKLHPVVDCVEAREEILNHFETGGR